MRELVRVYIYVCACVCVCVCLYMCVCVLNIYVCIHIRRRILRVLSGVRELSAGIKSSSPSTTISMSHLCQLSRKCECGPAYSALWCVCICVKGGGGRGKERGG